MIFVHFENDDGTYSFKTQKELDDFVKKSKKKIEFQQYSPEYSEIEEMEKELENVEERKYPWTRIEWPEKITIVKHLKPAQDSIDVVCCDSLEAARELRTELIKSLELLNFYIDQVEKEGHIRYVR